MALLSDMVPIRGTEGLGVWGNGAVMVRDKFGKKQDCPSWTGKGGGEQGSGANRRERGQAEVKCVCDRGLKMCLLSKKQ